MKYDAVIIGGGPAGAVCAHRMASAGLSALVIEREHFPRFHIGESLLPKALPAIAQTGLDLSAGDYLRKDGAEFIDERSGRAVEFSFGDGLPAEHPDYAWQVERAPFDDALLKCARKAGAEVHHGERVEIAEAEGDSVRVQTSDGEYLARYCIDATGQNAFFGRRQHSIEPIKKFGKAAVFRHYEGIDEALHDELYAKGNIKVLLIEQGWVWIIPLQGRKLSVGVVKGEGTVTEALYDEVYEASPLLQRYTAGAQEMPKRRIGNFSYKTSDSFGARYTCLGDAACFLDPVFSSGVCLAVVGADEAMKTLVPALQAEGEARADLMQPWSEKMELAYKTMASLIFRFYHTGMVENLFFHEGHARPEIRQGLISVLAGDFWRDDNPFQDMLLRANRVRV